MQPTKLDSLNDASLLSKWCSGNKEAIRILYDRYYEIVFMFVWRYVKNAEDANDISQEVWKSILENKRIEIKNLKAWIATIAKNKSIDFIRKKRTHSVRQNDLAEFPKLVDDYDLEQQIIVRNILEKCYKKIKVLPPLQAQCYYLRVIKELSYKEIAYQLDISEKAVQGRIQRAKERFKKYRDNDFNNF